MIGADALHPETPLRPGGGAESSLCQHRGRGLKSPLCLSKESAQRAVVVVQGSRRGAFGRRITVRVRQIARGVVMVVATLMTTVRCVKLVADETMPAGPEQGDAAKQGRESPDRSVFHESLH